MHNFYVETISKIPIHVFGKLHCMYLYLAKLYLYVNLQENESGDVIISMDANFGLVRKKSAGKSVQPPKHGTRMFLSQDEVQVFVANDNDDTSADNVSL